MNFLNHATDAARQAGQLLRDHFEQDLIVDELKPYDIKLELDRRAQELITTHLLTAFPDHAVLGEEGSTGDPEADYVWIVDPIDGTVNFYYGIPHFCVSIALQHRGALILGVIYDPMMDELFAAEKGGPATRNGRPLRVSSREKLAECVITVGFSKSAASIEEGGKRYLEFVRTVRKTRLMGSAALALAYIAAGRLDAYVEEVISLWDIAAGQVIVEAAGGHLERRPSIEGGDKMMIIASNGRVNLGI
jgi:myo-inositol-1(or 4)-monophosphatase